MASSESKNLRASFVKAPAAVETPVEVQRQDWEDAVEATNVALDATITAVQINGLPGEWVSAGSTTDAGAVLFLHGGGYNAGSCKTHRAMAARLAEATHLPVLLVDYRLAPEHPFPAAVEDAVAAYQWVLQQGFAAQQIVMGGDSAGGGLVGAALVKLRDDGIALPAAAFLISPWVDLALSGPSMQTHTHLDPLTTHAALHKAAQYYVGQRDPQHPLASPLYADLHGLPPLLIQVGEHELLLSDATRLAEKARAAGVEVQLDVWDEMWHVWHGWAAELPEAREAIGHIGEFVRRQLASHGQAT